MDVAYALGSSADDGTSDITLSLGAEGELLIKQDADLVIINGEDLTDFATQLNGFLTTVAEI